MTEQLLLVVAGGLIGILAGPVTELAKYWLTQKQRRDDRKRALQRETLLALASHLKDASIAAVLARLEREQAGCSEALQSDRIATFEENAVEARHHSFFVDEEHVRTLTRDTLQAAGRSIMATDKASATAEGDKAADLYNLVGTRIGELVRNL